MCQLIFATMLGLLVGIQPTHTAETEDLTANRLKRLGTYLHTSAVMLDGENEAGRKTFPPMLPDLWKHTEVQYEVIFGTAKKKERFANLDRSLKSLENCVYEILATLWGDSWRDVIHPLPPKRT